MDAVEWQVLDPASKSHPQQLLKIFINAMGSPQLRQLVIQHPDMSTDPLIQFIQTHELGDLALSMTADRGVLMHFAQDVNPQFRAIVAFNADVPEDLAEVLAKDLHQGVRVNAVYAPSLRVSTRVRLSRHDASAEVRDEAWHALTTVNGRAMVDGARLATHDFDDSEGSDSTEDREIWVLYLPI